MADKSEKDGGNKTVFVLTNVSAGMVCIAKQDILPGKTSEPIDPGMVEAVKKSPPYRAGKIVEGKRDMPAAKIIPLDKMEPEQAKKLIDTETSLEVLQAWIEAEKRPAVMVMLRARVAAL